ncbi:putative conjugal transfer protein/MT3759 [archaeon BMS3Bbin15]|nr:putative conjugal transfer protein/MT3759 [archaeon BMS3Bbin15]
MVVMPIEFFDKKKKESNSRSENDSDDAIDELISKIKTKKSADILRGEQGGHKKKSIKFDLKKVSAMKKKVDSEPTSSLGELKNTEAVERQGEEERGGSQMGGILGSIYKEKSMSRTSDHFGTFDRIKSLSEEIVGEVLKETERYRIVRKTGEKLPYYIIFLPDLSDEDREKINAIEQRAIAEINIDPDNISSRTKRWDTFMKEVTALIDLHYSEIPKNKRYAFAELIVQNMVGYGLLEPMLNDDNLEEVMVIGTGKSVYVYHRTYGMCRTNVIFEDEEEIMNIINRIARSIARRVDLTSPLLDARLPDGSRVNATIPPVSIDGPSLTIRKFKVDPLTIVDIMNFGTMTPELLGFLWFVVEGYGVKPANFLVSGGTSSGKTTTLNCLGSFIPRVDRVISIEDTAELQLPLEHWIRLETRPTNVEGRGEISMEILLKNVLRMRPDRIIVGEVRGKEAMTLLAAMNTGQNGCLGTVHANTAKETITRLNSEPMSVPEIMIPSLDFIFMQNRFSYMGKTVRRISEIAEVIANEDNMPKVNIIYEWDPKDDKVKPTGTPCVLLRKIAELRGVSFEGVEAEIERRVKVINYMKENNVKGLKNVDRIINEYYINPDELLMEIEGYPLKQKVKPALKRTTYTLMSEKEEEGEILYKDDEKKIVKVKTLKNPKYVVRIPPLRKREMKIMRELENLAIKEVEIDPDNFEDKEEVRRILFRKVVEIIERRFSELPFSKRKDIARLVVNNMVGYGLLDFLLDDEQLEEIMVIGTGKPIYVIHSNYGSCITNLKFETDEDAIRIVEKIAASVGRRIDKSSPLLDARLPDGSRVNATVPPISIDGPTITIRKFKADPLTVVNLIDYRTLSIEVSAYLWMIVEGLGIKPGNILTAGGAGSGKTTTLNVLGSFIPTTERVITIEDTAELTLPIEHVVRFETKPPNVEGVGEITMDDLVKNTLRMRPDRIIVGEVRGAEARTLFTAMNTGHDGCMGTLHSNSAKETIIRLTNPPMNVPKIMLPALNLILMQNKIYSEDSKILRRITEVAEVVTEDEEGSISLNYVYIYEPKDDRLVLTGQPSILKQKLSKLRGITVKELEEDLKGREKILRWMTENNIVKIEDVSKIINRYYADSKTLLEEVEIHTLNR